MRVIEKQRNSMWKPYYDSPARFARQLAVLALKYDRTALMRCFEWAISVGEKII